MAIDRFLNLLATVTLFEMTVTIGLGVSVAEIAAVAKDRGTALRAGLANYLVVPAAAASKAV
jgi:bile acid:Na+ symporter, BASS family